MRQISRRMKMIYPTIGWRRDEHGNHKHAHGSWILWSVSGVRSKAMHSLSCITSWLPYITLCFIDSRCFTPLEQSRTALLAAASQPRVFARLLVGNYYYYRKFIPNWNCHYWVSQQTELTQSKTPPTAITDSIMLSKGTWSIKECDARALFKFSSRSRRGIVKSLLTGLK